MRVLLSTQEREWYYLYAEHKQLGLRPILRPFPARRIGMRSFLETSGSMSGLGGMKGRVIFVDSPG